jgi:hypothetical protein
MKTARRVLLCFIVSALVWNLILGAAVCRLPYTVQDSPAGKHYAPNSTYVEGTEGYAKTVFDENGYNNDPGVPDKGRLALVLGDSHTEALQVARSENFCSVAQKLLSPGAGLTVYNCGVSGQSVADYIYYGAGLLKKFNPAAVVIQVTYPDFTDDALSGANNCSIVPVSGGYSVVKLTGGASTLKNLKDRFVSLCAFNSQAYIKFKKLLSGALSPDRRAFLPRAAATAQVARPESYAAVIDWEAAQLKSVYGDKAVILYLPYTPSIGASGQVVYSDPLEKGVKALIIAACGKYGIPFIDMQPDFDNLVKTKREFPRGFANTSPGSGHLNAQGHYLTGVRLAEYLSGLSRRQSPGTVLIKSTAPRD